MVKIWPAFAQSTALETRESVPYLNDLIFFFIFFFPFSYNENISSSELQNFPSDGIGLSLAHPTPRGTAALRRPQRACNRRDSWRGGRQEPRNRYQGGSVSVLESRCTPYPSFTSTKGCVSFALAKTALLAGRLHSEPSWTRRDRQRHAPSTSPQQTGRPVFLRSRLPDSLKPGVSPCWLCSRLPFPLGGAFTSSAVGLLPALRSPSSPAHAYLRRLRAMEGEQ